MVRDPAEASNVDSLAPTRSGSPSGFFASGPGPLNFQQRPAALGLKPCSASEKLWGASVPLTTATARVRPSAVSAADKSSGYVSPPVLTLGWSPPTGYFGAGVGELPLTTTGTLPKRSWQIWNIRPLMLICERVR